MGSIIFGYLAVISLVLIITIIAIIVQIGIIANLLIPVFASSNITEQLFTAKLFGDMEVPPIETNATGWAEFKPILTENTLTYTLNVTDIDNITAAHIHIGKYNQNGPIVVTLFRPDIPTPKMVSGLLSEGDITPDNLEGPLADKQISDLLDAMQSMELYVNVHTTKYPDGEIRGLISNSTSSMMMK
jgi:hypothetical protein